MASGAGGSGYIGPFAVSGSFLTPARFGDGEVIIQVPEVRKRLGAPHAKEGSQPDYTEIPEPASRAARAASRASRSSHCAPVSASQSTASPSGAGVSV